MSEKLYIWVRVTDASKRVCLYHVDYNSSTGRKFVGRASRRARENGGYVETWAEATGGRDGPFT